LPGFFVAADGRVFHEKSWGYFHQLATRPKEERYLVAQLFVGGRNMPRKVHSLVAGAFLPPPPSPVHVLRHRNGNMLDNRAENLEWGTQAENMKDAVAHGVLRKGEQVHTARLDEAQVREIRRLCASGWTNIQIAAHFGIPRQRVYNVVTRKCWKHVA
jgi:hypothetical protein